jgi:recombination protein RecT
MSTALAKPEGIRAIISGDRFKGEIAKALPRHLTPDRFLRIALTAITKTPKLADCTPESLCACLITLSSLGIEPDGRRAHLIPYGTTCTLIVDYKGLAELVLRSGDVSRLHADVVCENDEFAYDLGAIRQHKIDFRKPRGEAYAAYALAEMKSGQIAVAVMSKDEIEGIRKRSKSGNSGPWVTDWNEMAKKTAFRRLSKWLPLSPEIRDATEEGDDDQLTEVNVTPTARFSIPAESTGIRTAEIPKPDNAQAQTV